MQMVGSGAKERLARAFEISQVAGGLVIVALAIISAIINYQTISGLLKALDNAGPGVAFGYVFSTWGYAVLYVPLLLIFASVGLFAAIRGFRSLVIPDLPTSGSEPFRDYEEFRRGLQEHSLSCYRPLGAFISAVFSERTMYLSPLRKAIVQRNGSKLKWRLVWIALAALFIFWVHQSVKDSPNPNYRLALPFAWLILLQLTLGFADFLSCLLLVPQAVPRAESHEAQEFYKGFGHHAHLFSRLPDLGEQLRLYDQPNRTYVIRGEKATTAVSDVGEFGGMFYIERHPEPIDSGREKSASVLLATGWLLRLVGCFLFLFLLLPSELRDFAVTGVAEPFLPASPLFLFVMLVAAASAWLNGTRYFRQASDLIGSSWFKSVGILINTTGVLARADINVGKSTTDSLESKNVAARSDFTARFWAAELVSEAVSSTAPRELLALNRTEKSLNWIETFKGGIHKLREERVTPVGIDLRSAELSEITDANALIFANRARALQSPLPTVSIAAPMQALHDGGLAAGAETEGPRTTAGSEESKECPQCAETVKFRARKCRFCGHEFEALA